VAALRDVMAGRVSRPESGPPLWDGHAGPRIAAVLDAWLAERPEATEATETTASAIEAADR